MGRVHTDSWLQIFSPSQKTDEPHYNQTSQLPFMVEQWWDTICLLFAQDSQMVRTTLMQRHSVHCTQNSV